MGPDDLIICRCEEITLKEIVDAIDAGCRSIDEVKRVTRAGMGPCQGRTCTRLVQRLLAERLGVPPGQLEGMTVQFPVRPVRIASIVAAEFAANEDDPWQANVDEAV